MLSETDNSLESLLAKLVFYRTYARRTLDRQENFKESLERVLKGLSPFLSLSEQKTVRDSFLNQTSTPAGRFHWVGGTEWVQKPENFSGVFNCSSLPADSFDNLQQAMSLLMQGCGVGLIVEKHLVARLPFISSKIELEIVGNFGDVPKYERLENTILKKDSEGLDNLFLLKENEEVYSLVIGDSRQGWCQAFRYLLEMASKPKNKRIILDISNVRQKGEKIQGFGGTANPNLIKISFPKVVNILNKAFQRQLKPTEVMLLIGTLANLICAGNVRRSAIIFQGSSDDREFQDCKKDIWVVDEKGNFELREPELDGYLMANNTRVFHTIPSYQEIHEAVLTQLHSGEGAIMNAQEAVFRANIDIFTEPYDKYLFYLITNKGDASNFTPKLLEVFNKSIFQELNNTNLTLKEFFSNQFTLSDFISKRFQKTYNTEITKEDLEHRLNRYGLNPCLSGETLIPVIKKDKEVLVPIKDLSEGVEFIGFNTDIYPKHTVIDGLGKRVSAPFYQTSKKKKTITLIHKKVGGEKEYSIVLTPEHKVFKRTKNGDTVIAAEHLNPGDDLIGRKTEKGIAIYRVVEVKQNEEEIPVYCCSVSTTKSFETETLIVHNCGEVIGSKFHCNLAQVVLNNLNPFDFYSQIEAFKAASLSASVLLNGSFYYEPMEESRKLDPIIQVTVTGLVDFFIFLFGENWIKWWENDRQKDWKEINKDSLDISEIIEKGLVKFPKELKSFGKEDIFDFEKIKGKNYSYFYTEVEKFFYSFWQDIVKQTVSNYCQKHSLKIPNRVTGMQPSGTKSILTNSSNGVHPSFSKYYIRRVTIQKGEFLGLIALKLGLKVIPDSSSKHEDGTLLAENQIYHPDCLNWLVEFPICANWVKKINYSGEYDPGEYSFSAMWDFYSLVQNHWTQHNTSATIYFSEEEVDIVADKIHQGFSDGYISTALMPRMKTVFPRMPFEAISKERYENEIEAVQERKQTDLSFEQLLLEVNNEAIGPAQCDSDKCLIS